MAGSNLMRRDDNREPNAGPGEKCGSMVDQAMDLASRAFQAQCLSVRDTRRDLLLDAAGRLDAQSGDILAMAEGETHLNAERLRSELKNDRPAPVLCGSGCRRQLGRRTRRPRTSRPAKDLTALGPVVVFGASNFPLAFSTPGGDTAFALAAGCPVVVKGHPAHPATSDLVAQAFADSLICLDLPQGIFQLVRGGVSVSEDLVDHPATTAVGFKGSLTAGRALFNRAAARDSPIPVFAEMGSQNPVFLLPGAVASRRSEIASGLAESVTLGVGQFCPKPGVVAGIGIGELASRRSS